MNFSGNAQSFTLAIVAFIGFFAYILSVPEPSPVVFPAVVGLVMLAGTFFFGGHIANGAAAKAVDVLRAQAGEPVSRHAPQPDAGDIKTDA